MQVLQRPLKDYYQIQVPYLELGKVVMLLRNKLNFKTKVLHNNTLPSTGGPILGFGKVSPEKQTPTTITSKHALPFTTAVFWIR